MRLNPFPSLCSLALIHSDRCRHRGTTKYLLCLHERKRSASQITSIIPIYSVTSSEEAELWLVMSYALSEFFSHLYHVKSDF